MGGGGGCISVISCFSVELDPISPDMAGRIISRMVETVVQVEKKSVCRGLICHSGGSAVTQQIQSQGLKKKSVRNPELKRTSYCVTLINVLGVEFMPAFSKNATNHPKQ